MMGDLEYKYFDYEHTSGLGIYRTIDSVSILVNYQGLIKYYHCTHTHPTKWSCKRLRLEKIVYYL